MFQARIVIVLVAGAAALVADVSYAQQPITAQIFQDAIYEGESWNGSLSFSTFRFGGVGGYGIEDLRAGQFWLSGSTGSYTGTIAPYDPIPDAQPFGITDLVSSMGVNVSGGSIFYQDTNEAAAYDVHFDGYGMFSAYQQTSTNPLNPWVHRGLISAGTTADLQFAVQNVAPTVQQTLFGSTPLSLSTAPMSVNEGSTIYTQIRATDPGADSLTFFVENGVTSPQLLGAGGNTPGSVRVSPTAAVQVFDGFRVRVHDDDTLTYFQPSNLLINNLNPIIQSILLPDFVQFGQLFNFSATAIDPGFDALAFGWDFDDDGDYDDFTGSSGMYALSNTGPQTVRLRVADGDGGFAFGSQIVTVQEVPEPSSLALVAIGGLIGGVRYARRRHGVRGDQ